MVSHLLTTFLAHPNTMPIRKNISSNCLTMTVVFLRQKIKIKNTNKSHLSLLLLLNYFFPAIKRSLTRRKISFQKKKNVRVLFQQLLIERHHLLLGLFSDSFSSSLLLLLLLLLFLLLLLLLLLKLF